MLILSRHLLSWYLLWSLTASYKIKTLTKDKKGSLLNYLLKYSHFKYFSGHITNFRSINITTYTFSSVQFSRSVMSNSLRPHGLQDARPPCPSPTPRVYPNSCQLSRWCHPTMLSPSPPAPNPSQHQGLFQWVSSSHQGAKVLEFQLQHQSFRRIFRVDFL